MDPSEDRFLRMPEVERVTALSRAHIYNLIKAGDFPKQRVLSARCSAWRMSEIREWMETRALVATAENPIPKRAA